jgi:hypothetical protein
MPQAAHPSIIAIQGKNREAEWREFGRRRRTRCGIPSGVPPSTDDG